jgi:hypothetical protein
LLIDALKPKRSRPVGAPKLTIQKHRPLWIRVLGWLFGVAIGAGAAILVWQNTIGKGMAQREALVQELATTKTELSKIEQERLRLQALADSADSKLKIERTAQQNLANQLKTVEAENAKLKSDLAYMESLLPAGSSANGLAIRRFVLERDRVPNQWQFKALLVQTDKSERDFSGSMQVVMTGAIGGKPTTFTWPEAGKDGAAKAKLTFRRSQRLEEMILVPADFTIRSAQLRILEQGSVRAQQSVTLQP